jgi:hypothetical protein
MIYCYFPDVVVSSCPQISCSNSPLQWLCVVLQLQQLHLSKDAAAQLHSFQIVSNFQKTLFSCFLKISFCCQLKFYNQGATLLSLPIPAAELSFDVPECRWSALNTFFCFFNNTFNNVSSCFIIYFSILVISMAANPVKDASIFLRNQLKANYVILPEVSPRVSIERYFLLCERLYKQAYQYYQNKNIQLVNAYIDFQKFLILILDRIPKHPQYKLINVKANVAALSAHDRKLVEYKNWVEGMKVKAMLILEEIVGIMDKTEYEKQQTTIEQSLEDEFDNIPISTTIPPPELSSRPLSVSFSTRSITQIQNMFPNFPSVPIPERTDEQRRQDEREEDEEEATSLPRVPDGFSQVHAFPPSAPMDISSSSRFPEESNKTGGMSSVTKTPAQDEEEEEDDDDEQRQLESLSQSMRTVTTISNNESPMEMSSRDRMDLLSQDESPAPPLPLGSSSAQSSTLDILKSAPQGDLALPPVQPLQRLPSGALPVTVIAMTTPTNHTTITGTLPIVGGGVENAGRGHYNLRGSATTTHVVSNTLIKHLSREDIAIAKYLLATNTAR